MAQALHALVAWPKPQEVRLQEHRLAVPVSGGMRAFKHHGHQFSRTRLDWRDAIPVCAHSHFGKDLVQSRLQAIRGPSAAVALATKWTSPTDRLSHSDARQCGLMPKDYETKPLPCIILTGSRTQKGRSDICT